VLIGAVSLAIYAGLYNIAADVPHTQPLYWLIETVRNSRWPCGRVTLLFQMTWMTQTASHGAQASTRRCAAVVILRLA
jgi:hypothetical protein